MAFAMDNLDLARTSFKRALDMEPEVGAAAGCRAGEVYRAGSGAMHAAGSPRRLARAAAALHAAAAAAARWADAYIR